MHDNTRIRSILLALAAAACLASSAPAAPATATAPAATRPATFDALVASQITAILDQAAKDNNFSNARAAMERLFEQLAAYAGERHAASFRDTAFALRLVTQLEKTDASTRTELLGYLRANDALARTLAFLLESRDDPKAAYALLNRLREKHGKDLNTYATLAAAICVVHDRPLSRHINENLVKAGDPVELYEYYVKYENQLYFGVKNVPAELLIWVVDTTTPPDQLAWALQKYARDDAVGRHFFDIKYDHEHLRTGRPKQVTQAGYNLPNILKYGGVCADQAYFAMEVGKAIGVPTAYASGAGGTSNHAWVGFLQAQNVRGSYSGWWNFDTGRYEEYKGVRGNVLHPQTREGVPDALVSLSAELIGTKPADRQLAAAMTDAAALVIARIHKQEKGALTADPFEGNWPDLRKKPREATAESALELLESGLRKNPGYARGWLAVRDLAKDGALTFPQKTRWSDILLKLCGQKYPDFALAILEPMIVTVDDAKEQDRLWSGAFVIFEKRADLAAAVRMNQAHMWEEKGNTQAAGQCYLDVINRFANAGPFVLNALAGAEKLLRTSNKADKVPVLYEDTWAKIKKPKEMAGPFMRQSNWYRVGKQLAAKYREAGDEKKAALVEGQLEPAAAAGK